MNRKTSPTEIIPAFLMALVVTIGSAGCGRTKPCKEVAAPYALESTVLLFSETGSAHAGWCTDWSWDAEITSGPASRGPKCRAPLQVDLRPWGGLAFRPPDAEFPLPAIGYLSMRLTLDHADPRFITVALTSGADTEHPPHGRPLTDATHMPQEDGTSGRRLFFSLSDFARAGTPVTKVSIMNKNCQGVKIQVHELAFVPAEGVVDRVLGVCSTRRDGKTRSAGPTQKDS